MKTNKLLLTILFLFILMGMGGCDNKDYPTDYYKGKIITLNKGDGCFDLIEIQQSVENGLNVGVRITFNRESHDKDFKEGDIVYFKIIDYQEWDGFAFAYCLWPAYVTIIEFYND